MEVFPGNSMSIDQSNFKAISRAQLVEEDDDDKEFNSRSQFSSLRVAPSVSILTKLTRESAQ